MEIFPHKLNQKVGLPPGSLFYTGKKTPAETKFQLIAYDESGYTYFESKEIEEVLEKCGQYPNKWINITGLNNPEKIAKTGEVFKLHALLLEDILNIHHLPKLDDYDDYLFLTFKMIYQSNGVETIDQEHLSFVLGQDFLLTFQEGEGDVFNAIRTRIFEGKGKVRKRSVDYLFYLLVDAVIDNYFLVFESIREYIEELEDEVLKDPSKETLQKINTLRKELNALRKVVLPLREIMVWLKNGGAEIIKNDTLNYFKDIYDHMIHIVEIFESFREMLTGLTELYMSNLSHSLNQVMKTLTIVATIFIPLTFIVGIYGMNFEYMPELSWQWGYLYIWIFMIITVMIMIVIMKRKNWF